MADHGIVCSMSRAGNVWDNAAMESFDAWSAEHGRWRERDLSAKRHVYWWSTASIWKRIEDHAQCILVIIGATPEGKKELVGFADGVRESAQSWRDLLLGLKRRGLSTTPQLAVADGARSLLQCRRSRQSA